MPAVLIAGREARPRRILLTADAVGGVWTWAMELARGLALHDMAVTLAVLGPAPAAAQRSEATRIPGLDLRVTELPLDWTTDSPDDVVQAGHALAALARRSGVDAALLHSAPLGAHGDWDVPVVIACHSCVATWWRTVRGEAPMPVAMRWRTAFAARGFARATRLVAPSAAFAQLTAAVYALPAPPTVVHNGRAMPTPALSRAIAQWLDRVAARLDAPVIAAGPLVAPHGERVQCSALHTPGALAPQAIAQQLARRPVFVSTARYEPFGLAVLEAAQAGCALVLADIPTFRELWDDAATFVPPGDDAALEQAIRSLLDDRVRRAMAGARAIARARRYTVTAMVQGTLAALAPAAMERAA
ncbi:MAG: glycosyltransferase [Gemmatimonadaceae bacterium]|nr:glycosyltransferase [Gemmatimonadaceae bacterium]